MIEFYYDNSQDCDQQQGIATKKFTPNSCIEIIIPEERESTSTKVEAASILAEAKAAAYSLFNMPFPIDVFPFPAPLARDKILETFHPREIYGLLDQHIKLYANWQNYIVKKASFAGYYGSDQKIYGCLMAGFTHILAEKIKEGTPIDQLIDLACYGRQLMCKMSIDSKIKPQDLSVDQAFFIAQYGSQRVLLDFEEKVPTTLINNEGKCVYTAVGHELAKLAEEWKKLNSPWIKAKNNYVIYRGRINEKWIPLSFIKDINEPSIREVIHTRLPELKMGMKHAKKLFEESLSLEGEALHQKLGEFFWWWCQLKPVKLGDPSVGELLVKAVLILKGCEVPGWKKGVVPWEETLKNYNPVHFGEIFSSFWDI